MIKWLEENKAVPRAMTGIIFILIYYISSLNFGQTLGPKSIYPVIYHIFIFFLLAFFLFISVLNRRGESKKIILVIIISLIYAALDELHQFFVPGRFSSTGDFLLDFTGISLATLIYFVMIAKNNCN